MHKQQKMKTWVWCWIYCTARALAYNIQYFDCSTPHSIQSFDKSSLCIAPAVDTEEQEIGTWQVLQQSHSGELAAVTCTVMRSKMKGFCGVWSHFKLRSAPSILRPLEISRDACQQMINTKKYRTAKNPDGYPLTLNRQVEFSEQARGGLWYENGALWCQGENQVNYKGEHLSDVVELQSYTVLIQATRLLARGNQLEDPDNQVKLECTKWTGHCSTGTRTYVWTPPAAGCQLAKVKTIQASKIGEQHLLSVANKMMLTLTKPFVSDECDVTGYHTNFENIIVTQVSTLPKTIRLDPHDVDSDLDWASALSYLEYHMGNRVAGQFTGMQQIICQTGINLESQKPVRLQSDQFVLVRGDVYLLFKCPAKQARIAQVNECYNQVPLAGGGFVEPGSRLRVEHSEPILCSKYFPLIVQAGNTWLELPSLRTRSAPEQYPHGQMTALDIEDFSPAVLYSEAELTEFKELLSFPTYKQARQQEVLLGECRHKGHCGMSSREGGEVPVFDLDQLKPQILEDLDPRTWWHEIQTFMSTSGNYISLVALLVFSVQLTYQLKVILNKTPVGRLLGQLVMVNFWKKWDADRKGAKKEDGEEMDNLVYCADTQRVIRTTGDEYPSCKGVDPILAV